MRFNAVSYSRIYPMGMYANEKISVEVIVNELEDPKKALAEAKRLCDEFHQENLKTYQEKQEEPIEEIKTQSPKTIAERTKEFLSGCKTKEELKAWHLMCKNNPELLNVYNEKFNQLP